MVLKEIMWPCAGNIKHTEITKHFPYRPHTKSDGITRSLSVWHKLRCMKIVEKQMLAKVMNNIIYSDNFGWS